MRDPLPYCPTPPRPCASSFAASWDEGDTSTEEKKDAPHQGREAGARSEVRQARDGHRLAGGPDRDADAAHQRADRPSADAQARSLLASRAAQARGSPPPLSELPAAQGPRG